MYKKYWCVGIIYITIILIGITVKAATATELVCDPQEAVQGQTVEAFLIGAESEPTIIFRKKSLKAFPCLTSSQLLIKNPKNLPVYRALICVPADLEPGVYTVCAQDEKVRLTVKPGKFAVQKIHLPKEKNNFNATPGEKESVEAAKNTQSPEQFWQGKFTKPSLASISASYGLRREVNGRLLKDYFHSGIDYAGSLNSPVYACQAGRVLLAHKDWKLHGNLVCIDHGQGVVSFYLHLNKILVTEGQSVSSQQLIGKVGATGRANGPHLHFSIYVNGEAANPIYWFSSAY